MSGLRWLSGRLSLVRQADDHAAKITRLELDIETRKEIMEMQREALQSVTMAYRAMWAQNSVVANELTRRPEQ